MNGLKKSMLFILLLSSILVMSGCSTQKDQNIQTDNTLQKDTPVSMKVWASQDDQELLAKIVESFKEKYAEQAAFDIVVEAVNEGDCKDQILGDVNSAADVFAFPDDQLMPLAAAGVLEALEDTEQIKNENLEGAVAAATINEDIYAYPMTADNGYFLYYNKKYLTEQDVQTLDGILAVAASQNKKMVMDWSSGWYLYSFFGNTGLKLGLNEDGITNYCDWNSKTGDISGVEVGNAMLSIAGHAGFGSANDNQLLAGVKDGTVIAGVSGVWNAHVLKDIWKDDFAAVKLPTYTCAGEQVQMASYSGYKMIGVNAYSEEKEWAKKLAEWIVNEENQTLRFEERGQGPSNINAANSEEVSGSPAISALLEQSAFASLQRVGNNYWIPVETFAENLLDQKASPNTMQSLLDQMVKEITMKVTD